MIAFLNNSFISYADTKLHVADMAVQRGYGVFDFFKTINNIPVFLNEHLQRFYFSAGEMSLPVPFEKQELKEIIHQLIQHNNIPNSGIRITLTGGYSEDGYSPAKPNLIITQKPLDIVTAFSNKPYRLVTYHHQRQLPQVKSIDYLMAVWLQKFWKEKDADDVLYKNGNILTECPRSNIFMITNDEKIITPQHDILKGITRNIVVVLAQKHFSVEERNITLEDLQNTREAFITSTTKSILPVHQIDHCPFTNHSITQFLFNELQSHIHTIACE